MAQEIAAISNVNRFSANHSTFNMTFNPGKDPDDEIAKWLTSVNFRTIQIDTLSKRTPQTGTWLIESPEYQAWLSSDSGLLWVKGLPGAGKTILSSIVIHHLQERFSSDQETAIVFAFCRHTDSCSVTDILASFVKQLAQDRPSIVLPIVKPIYIDHKKKETRLSERHLQELLQVLLQLFKKTYIAIDALDELPDHTRATLLTALSLLRTSRASLLVTSRPLQLLEPHLPDACIHVEAENQKDIELFIDKQIEETPRLRVLLEGKQHDRRMICATLKQKSQGMFLLAALQTDSLKHCISVNKLHEAVNSLPSGLNAFYQRTLERIESQTKDEVSLARKAIIWLTYAYRSLTIAELQHALAVSDGMERFDEDDTAAKDLIISVCYGLIVVDKRGGIVRLVHYTTYDFFRKFSFDICVTPHTLIATSCVAYLSAFGFGKQELLTKDQLFNFLRRRPLLDYAYRYWGSHSKACYGEAGLPATVFTCLAQWNTYPYICDDGYDSLDLLGPSHIAASYGLPDALPVTGEWCNQVTRIKRYTPLILASTNGHREIVAILVSRHDVNVNSKDTDGRTALFPACKNGHERIVELLLSRNDIDIQPQTVGGQTALIAASQNGHERTVRLLLSRKDVAINARTSRYGEPGGQTALFGASTIGHEGIIELLLSRQDVDINSQTEDGQTALFTASEKGHEGVVRLLLSRKDVAINTSTTKSGHFGELCGQTALFAASKNGHEEIVKSLLCRKDVDINSQTTGRQTALLAASCRGHKGIVKLLLSRKNIDINTTTTPLGYFYFPQPYGQSALFWASKNGHEGIVKLLLSRNDLDTNLQTDDGETALFVASKEGHEGIIRFLLSRNDVDINSQTENGETALFAATKEGHEGTVKLLLSRKHVAINTSTTKSGPFGEPSGQTALFVASVIGHKGIVKLLLSRNNVDINSQTDDGQTALFAASKEGHEEIVKLFLSRKDVAINTTTTKSGDFFEPSGQTALFAASKNGHEGIVKLLLSRKDIAVNTTTTKSGDFYEPSGQTALFAASKNGHKGIVKLLVSREDVAVNVTTTKPGGSTGQTPLFVASRNAHEGIVALLLSRHDVDINSQTEDGQTALSAASYRKQEGIVKMLLARMEYSQLRM